MTSEHTAEKEQHLWTLTWLAYLEKQKQTKMVMWRRSGNGRVRFSVLSTQRDITVVIP